MYESTYCRVIGESMLPYYCHNCADIETVFKSLEEPAKKAIVCSRCLKYTNELQKKNRNFERNHNLTVYSIYNISGFKWKG